MKRLIIILCFGAAFTSCKKFLDVNDNPNQPSEVSPDVILTAAEVQLGYTVGGADFSLVSAIFAQQITGIDRQFTAYNSYVFSADNFTNGWGNIYQTMLNLKQLKDVSDAEGYKYYSGVSGILLADALGITTDLWGDVPFSDAFQGETLNFKPTYDTQSDIYTTIMSLLDEAVTNLSNPAPGGIKPGSDDIIYGGDPGKWIKLANSLKLRYLLHQSKLDPSVAGKIISGLSAPGGVITSNADNAVIWFLDDDARANPLYQFFTQRDGYATLESTGSDILTALDDPRKGAYMKSNFNIGDFLGSKPAGVVLMSAAEVSFIEAEARAMNSDMLGAAAAYTDGIKLSFDQVGVSGVATYLAKPSVAFATAPGSPIERIIKQKYLALYLQPEVYNDWRRTGFPTLTPNSTARPIPRRFLYPQTELSYNSGNVPKNVTLATNVWWDK